MTTEQQRIYTEAYRAGIEALESTVAFRTHRTVANEQKAKEACEAAIKAANAASMAKAALEYGEAYERLCHHRDGFDRVVRAVKLLRQRGVDVKLSSSITPANAADVPEMLKIAAELDVPIRMDTYMMPASRERSKPFTQQNRLLPERAAAARITALRAEMGEELFAHYRAGMLEQIDQYQLREPQPTPISCHAGKCSFTVNWQGKLRPCVILAEPEADVFEQGFAAGWQQVSRSFLATRYCAQCSACRLRPLCRTCAAAARLESGDYMGTPEYLCRYAAESERLLREGEVTPGD